MNKGTAGGGRVLAILLLAVGLRFALELMIQPSEPFSITVQEART